MTGRESVPNGPEKRNPEMSDQQSFHANITQSHSVEIDVETWERGATYRWFRAYAKPHYAITCRVDVSHLMQRRKAEGVSPYRACLYAIGAGIHAVPELCMRFRDETVVRHSRVELSMTVPRSSGGFTYAYVPWREDFARFDRETNALITRASEGEGSSPIAETADAVVFLSCLPWLDFTGLDQAVIGPDDCIPRVSWGKIVSNGARHEMAVNVQVHHALVDGAHLGGFFDALQGALDTI